jgi:hypothetical protein
LPQVFPASLIGRKSGFELRPGSRGSRPWSASLQKLGRGVKWISSCGEFLFRGDVQRAIQFNGGASRPDGQAVEARWETEALDQGGVGFQPGVRPPFAAGAGCAEDGGGGVRGAFGPRALREMFRGAPGQGGIRVEKDPAHGLAVALAPEHSGCDWDQDSGYPERTRISSKTRYVGPGCRPSLRLNPDQPSLITLILASLMPTLSYCFLERSIICRP